MAQDWNAYNPKSVAGKPVGYNLNTGQINNALRAKQGLAPMNVVPGAGYTYGWQDPVAQQIYGEMGGGSVGKLLAGARSYEQPGSAKYNSPLDPSTWGSVFRGDLFDKMATEYQKRAAAAGRPNVGVSEVTPPAAGSMHTLAPGILSKMWR